MHGGFAGPVCWRPSGVLGYNLPKVSRKRSQRQDKLAQLYDNEILPVWSERFGRMLLRDLPVPEKGQILDVACGTGYPAVEIIRRMNPDTRLIAIDPVSVMLDEARKKVEAMGAKGVFFRTESAEPKLSFADDVYDLVVCNLGLDDFEKPAHALADFARVTKPGGQVRCTLPLEGTFQEFYDIYREVLTKHDKHRTLELLEEHLAAYATVRRCESWLQAAPLIESKVIVDEFTMLFRSSREFFFAPVIEYGPLATWKAIAGRGQEMQDIFWYIKEAIDSYFEGRAFEVTVKAGCLIGTKPDADTAVITSPVQLVDLESAPLELVTEDLGDELGELGELGDDEVQISFEDEEPEVVTKTEPETEDPETEEPETIDRGAPVSRNPVPVPTDSIDEVPLDAFQDGAERPEHLVPTDPE